MKRLQHWFDQIVGIAQIEEEHRARAREIFGSQGICESALALPACWRRSSRVVLPSRR